MRASWYAIFTMVVIARLYGPTPGLTRNIHLLQNFHTAPFAVAYPISFASLRLSKSALADVG
jgi:hypothetical protein